jgi:hypothetical protein
MTLFGESVTVPRYGSDGQLMMPKDYREWVFLSSGYATTYDTEGANNPNLFHNVFVPQAAYHSFMKTGTWPDKTVMVLELRRSANHVSINRQGQVQTDVAAIEVHVKDASRSKETGGWGFYGFTPTATTGKPFPRTADCFTCHQNNGATDTTFVQFYPTVIDAAKAHGNFKDTEHK